MKIEIKNEAVLAIIGYKLEDALARARQEAQELPLVYTGQNSLVQDFINRLYLDSSVIPPIGEPIKPLSKKKLVKEEFKASLLLTLNEPQKWEMKISKKDKKLLSEIIEKL